MGSDPAGAYPPDADESPAHVVSLDRFRISRTPVTNGAYRAFAPAPGPDDRPVTYVSWDDAHAFCRRAGVRLPSEAEWEAAARGRGERLWPWGDELPDATRAVFERGIGGPSPVGTCPAGASPCGALDLAGNVAEWVADAYDAYPAGADGPRRVVRGGSYIDGPGELRCSARRPLLAAARDPYVGFRVVAVEPAIDLDWVDVPAGEYPIGRAPRAYRGPALADETPQHHVHVDAFELSRTPVTNAQYRAFVDAAGAAAPPHWADAEPPADVPVTWVDWREATAFCAWAGGRLPTEAEWEKAARGEDGRIYPWGDEADPARAAVGARIEDGASSPVGAHPSGASPYGLLEMAGNVWEWTASAYAPYPFDPATDGEERVLRGGSYASPGLRWARCASRSRSRPARRAGHVGFRVARGAA
jgi:formylglycine-generating enzyme required for sulfatase activity